MGGSEVVHDWDWWAYQFRVVHREGIPGIEVWDDHLIAFVVNVLDLRPGERVLDLGCGSGEHALRLARCGLEVVGLDIAPSLVRHCSTKAAAEGLRVATFVEGDMCELAQAMAGEAAFDAVVMLSSSFGFFDDETNLQVLEAISLVLRPGGRVLLQLMDPLTFAERQRQGVFHEERPEGTYWTETWFDPATFVSHSAFRFSDVNGVTHLWDDHERVRVYTLPELRRAFGDAGLKVTAAYGDVALPLRPYGLDCSRQMIVVGKRP